MAPQPALVHEISRITVKPKDSPDGATSAAKNVHLSVWDAPMFNAHYVQKGLLFSNHSSPLPPIRHVIRRLESSLAAALLHFYPLAGRLATERSPSGLRVSIECSNRGAELVHASADRITVAQVLAPLQDVPPFVRSFFPYNHAINHDGHSIPLLAVQVTELADGMFLAMCFNHVVGDGTSFWHFFNSWAEIARSDPMSRPPVHDRFGPPVTLPFSDASEFLDRFAPPPLRERNFHFASRALAELKARANTEQNSNYCVISSFQALSALTWRCVTRARGFAGERRTGCRLSIQNRARLDPPLSPDYFGNSIYAMATETTAGELLGRSLGWAAGLLNAAVRAHDDGAIRGAVRKYLERPGVYSLRMYDAESVMMASSPRFDMYGCEFGWGKAVALRSGPANKFDGKVTSYPGREGGGSVDLEVCLPPEYMAALEMDEEFMSVASVHE